MQKTAVSEKIICFHCGDFCPDDSIASGDEFFCCNGCKTVYEILSENNLAGYYDLEKAPGRFPVRTPNKGKFDYLENSEIEKLLYDFSDSIIARVSFVIPQIHCASCIWLLENLDRLDPGIVRSTVNFSRKELSITFSREKTALKNVVELLAGLGYEPEINLKSSEKKDDKAGNIKKELYKKIAVAGFGFFNIMILSLPEYFHSSFGVGPVFKLIFNILKISLALPVFFYSASGYFRSAYHGIRQRQINMDLPISLGILILFGRSAYEISAGGAGYFDSFAGLVFFLLAGRLFQEKTYDSLSFERDYKSYFPIAVTVIENGKESSIPADRVKPGSKILARNGELIPADGILLKNSAMIDYSFVTGESEPSEIRPGDTVFAGGRVAGKTVEMEVTREVARSYLTELWGNEAFSKTKGKNLVSLANKISRFFTPAVLAIAAGAALYWFPIDPRIALNAATAVLIIACPCALALSTPFALGTAMRIFGRSGLYVKNSQVVENLARVDTIIFDKTGTITEPGKSRADFEGRKLSSSDTAAIRSLARQSSHPKSKAIYEFLPGADSLEVESFSETPGLGLRGIVGGRFLKIGSASWIREDLIGVVPETGDNNSGVYVSIDGELYGQFFISNSYRRGLKSLVKSLKKKFGIALLSGDNDKERGNIEKMLGEELDLHFDRAPTEKLEFVERLQKSGRKVLMMGDGLNDAGALKKSDVGITLSENTSSFSPACDGILDSRRFEHFDKFLQLSAASVNVIKISFAISFLYNLIGLSYAVAGMLSPLVSAILMPLSSISVVVFSTSAARILGRRYGF